MSLNNVTLQARIPFDLEIKNEDNEDKAYLMFSVSVRRNYKPNGEQYYPEDLIFCKAFGKKALFINQYFEKGSNLVISGSLRKDDDYTKDGEEKKGLLYVLINEVHFAGDSKSSNSSEEGSAKTSSTKKATTTKKAPAKKQSLNPFG